MANPTFTLIASNTVGSGGASSVTFSSIPATYTDLVVKASHRCDDIYPDTGFLLRFNGSTSNLSRITLYGYGTSGSQASTSSSSLINFFSTANGATANTFSNTDIYIPNYASANYKSVNIDSVNESNSANVLADLVAGLWSNTSAITSITLLSATSTNIMQYSTFSLYGVNNS
jgi:hypothetical protein